jgi:N-formylglutamate deformylase
VEDDRVSAGSFEVVAPSARSVPVLVHVPHSATYLPGDVRASLQLSDRELAEELRVMTDHHTDRLVAGTGMRGATRVINRWSRLAVDPERFDDPAAEEMEAVGMGAVYTATSDRRPLRSIGQQTREDLLARHFRPYHVAVAREVDRQLAAHDRCTILDVHSYPSRALPYELHAAGPRPPLCIGTDPRHTPECLRATVAEVADAHGLAWALDTPFRGTFVPNRHLDDPRVRSVMLEFRRDTYLDESTARPHDGLATLAGFCDAVVDAIVAG